MKVHAFFKLCFLLFLGASSLSAQKLEDQRPALEITAADYCEFFNAESQTGSWRLEPGGLSIAGSDILCSGAPGHYRYDVVEGKEDVSMTFVSQLDVIRYCDWKGDVQMLGPLSKIDESLQSNRINFQLVTIEAVSGLVEKSGRTGSGVASWRSVLRGALIFALMMGSGESVGEQASGELVTRNSLMAGRAEVVHQNNSIHGGNFTGAYLTFGGNVTVINNHYLPEEMWASIALHFVGGINELIFKEFEKLGPLKKDLDDAITALKTREEALKAYEEDLKKQEEALSSQKLTLEAERKKLTDQELALLKKSEELLNKETVTQEEKQVLREQKKILEDQKKAFELNRVHSEKILEAQQTSLEVAKIKQERDKEGIEKDRVSLDRGIAEWEALIKERVTSALQVHIRKMEEVADAACEKARTTQGDAANEAWNEAMKKVEETQLSWADAVKIFQQVEDQSPGITKDSWSAKRHHAETREKHWADQMEEIAREKENVQPQEQLKAQQEMAISKETEEEKLERDQQLALERERKEQEMKRIFYNSFESLKGYQVSVSQNIQEFKRTPGPSAAAFIKITMLQLRDELRGFNKKNSENHFCDDRRFLKEDLKRLEETINRAVSVVELASTSTLQHFGKYIFGCAAIGTTAGISIGFIPAARPFLSHISLLGGISGMVSGTVIAFIKTAAAEAYLARVSATSIEPYLEMDEKCYSQIQWSRTTADEIARFAEVLSKINIGFEENASKAAPKQLGFIAQGFRNIGIHFVEGFLYLGGILVIAAIFDGPRRRY